MRSAAVTEAWEFYRDNCPGFKEPMRRKLRELDEYVSRLEARLGSCRNISRRGFSSTEFVCSECGAHYVGFEFQYCPHCGGRISDE